MADNAGRAGQDRRSVLPHVDPMQQRCGLFEARLAAYLEIPGEAQIHDLRTSIRRMESTYHALPGSAKTAHSKRFFEQAKVLFQKTGRIRDADVITQILIGLGVSRDSDSIAVLSSARIAELEAAAGDAKKTAMMGAPMTRTVSIHKITARRKKVMWALFDEIRAVSAVVVSDESDVKRLHFMRKKIKRLRYLLEDEIKHHNAVAGKDSSNAVDAVNDYITSDARRSYHDALTSMLSSATQVQKSAGLIHDCDITIKYVTEHYSLLKADCFNPAELFDKLQSRRHALYLELVGS